MVKTYPIRFELPEDYLAGIGAVCFEWALQERALQYITYGLLKIGPKHGRVAVRSPRATDQITMIRQLMDIEKLTTTVDLKLYSANLGRLEKLRDLVAHGTWLKGSAGEYVLQDLSGTWKPDPHGPSVSKRITPAGMAVEAKNLLELASLIRIGRVGADQLGKELEAQRRALLSKPPQQSSDRLAVDQSPEKP